MILSRQSATGQILWFGFCLAVAGLASSVASLNGQTDSPASELAAGEIITTVTGQRLALQVQEISAGRLVSPERNLNVNALMSIETGRRIVDSGDAVQILLTGGGYLNARRVGFSNEKFQLFTPWGSAKLSTESVAGVWLKPDADRARFDLALANRSVEQDMVIATTSQGQQSVSGLLESMDDAQLLLNFEGQSRPISLSKVDGVVTADLKSAIQQGLRCTVRMTDGGMVEGILNRLQSGQLELGLSANDSIMLPWDAVSHMSFQSPSVVWLSDLDPDAVDIAPLATLPFEWQRDLSAGRQSMTLYWPSTGESRTFARGIGTRSTSRLEYAVPPGFSRLLATVGIDSETLGNGDCEVSVRGDGVQLWESRISGRIDPEILDLDISGYRKITLVVRYGKHMDLADHVDWADLRFVKTEIDTQSGIGLPASRLRAIENDGRP